MDFPQLESWDLLLENSSTNKSLLFYDENAGDARVFVSSGDDENLTTFAHVLRYGLETPRFPFFRHGKTEHVFPTPFLVRISPPSLPCE